MNIGVTLMIVGMVTVFAVLLIIINLSKLLIKLVNKFALEENVKKDVKQNGPEISANVAGSINTPEPIIFPHTSIVAINSPISLFKFFSSITFTLH